MALLVVLSIGGFGAFLALDAAPVARRPWLHRATSLVGLVLLTGAWFIAERVGHPLPWPHWLAWVGLPLMLLGGSLSLYTMFLEIPLLRRRMHVPDADAPTLICAGSYAMCRHPDFWWLAFTVVGYLLVARHTGALALALVWMCVKGVGILIQDAWMYPRRFADYHAYRQHTPFLIPTRASLRLAFERWGGGHEALSREDQRPGAAP